MGRALRQHGNRSRGGDRIPLHAGLCISTLDGTPIAPLARCTNIGLGGLRACAAVGLPPGTVVRIDLQLPYGGRFQGVGHVAWWRQTLHPRLFGSPRGMDDDGTFGIAFDVDDPEELFPIARLFLAREQELKRAQRIRRLRGYPFRA